MDQHGGAEAVTSCQYGIVKCFLLTGKPQHIAARDFLIVAVVLR
jgi:hypothetical protein